MNRPIAWIFALVAPSLGSLAIGVGLSASFARAAAARHHFQTLDFLAHGFVEDGVGQEDQPVCAGVGVVASI